MLKQNEGAADRVVRIIFGVILLSLAFLKLTGTIQVIVMIAGVLALVTGLLGFCALYQLFGISTRKAK